MNTPAIPTPEEVQAMREFLARVVRVPLTDIDPEGDPSTGNRDLLRAPSEKFDALRACTIDNILSGHTDTLPNGQPDLARGKAMFDDLLSERESLSP